MANNHYIDKKNINLEISSVKICKIWKAIKMGVSYSKEINKY